MVDPDVGLPIHNELEAVEAGYAQLRDEVAQFLGAYSVAARTLEEHQATIRRERSNVEFLEKFATFLPIATAPSTTSESVDKRPSFKLSTDAQAQARVIQEHTLWLSGNPYYLIGRSPQQEDRSRRRGGVGPKVKESRSVEDLLIVSAHSSQPQLIASVSILAEDMKARDELVEQLPVSEFTNKEIENMTHPISGDFVVNASTRGSIRIYTTIFKTELTDKSWTAKIGDLGIRTSGRVSAWHPITEHNTLSSAQIARFNVDEVLSRLAFAFGKEHELRELIGINDPAELPASSSASEAIFDIEAQEQQLSYEEVLVQNERLKDLLRDILLASGVLDRSDIDRLISEQYPHKPSNSSS